MLTAFGTAAVSLMFVTYWLEERSRWFVAIFAAACAASSSYGLLIGSYPFFAVELLWSLVALARFVKRSRRELNPRS